MVVRSLSLTSLTRTCGFLSGEEGGVPGEVFGDGRGARFGMSCFFGFLEEFWKKGRTMEARAGREG